jgi:hypothetical protein
VFTPAPARPRATPQKPPPPPPPPNHLRPNRRLFSAVCIKCLGSPPSGSVRFQPWQGEEYAASGGAVCTVYTFRTFQKFDKKLKFLNEFPPFLIIFC